MFDLLGIKLIGIFQGSALTTKGKPRAGGDDQRWPSSLTGILSSEHILFRPQGFPLSARLGNQEASRSQEVTANNE